MKIWLISLAAGVLLLFAWLIIQYGDRARLLRRLAANIAAGAAVLTVLDAISGLTALSLPVNLLSIGTGAILGAPGILGLCAIKLFF